MLGVVYFIMCSVNKIPMHGNLINSLIPSLSSYSISSWKFSQKNLDIHVLARQANDLHQKDSENLKLYRTEKMGQREYLKRRNKTIWAPTNNQQFEFNNLHDSIEHGPIWVDDADEWEGRDKRRERDERFIAGLNTIAKRKQNSITQQFSFIAMGAHSSNKQNYHIPERPVRVKDDWW